MTTELEDIAAARDELTEMRAEREAFAATAAVQAAPPSQSRFTPFELATRALGRRYPDLPLHEIQAQVGNLGVGSFKTEIAAEDARVLAADKLEADQVFAASPEGRAATAQALADQRRQTATQAANARLLIVEENGLDEASAASLTDSEALALAGFTEAPPAWGAEGNDYNANAAAIQAADAKRDAIETGTTVLT